MKSRNTFAAMLCTLGLIGPGQSSAGRSVDMTSAEQVKQSIITMVNAVDTNQWGVVSSKFADQVFIDYSSLTGQAGGLVDASDLVGSWEQLLNDVNSHHIMSNFDVSVKGSHAEAFSHVYASHTFDNIEHWDVFGRYHHKLSRVGDQWKVTSLTFTVHGQKGNLDFFKDVGEQQTEKRDTSMNSETLMKKVEFESEGEKVVGNLYFPNDYDPSKQYPAIVVSGSWTTVKEQMSGLYADRMADNGFITLAFDPRNFGESEGKARFYENTTQKIEDIKSAVSYLQSLTEVDSNKIGALGICAGSMYTLMAASEDKRIKSVVTVASWLHDAEAVKLFYGGEEGVQQKIDAAREAKRKFAETGEMIYIPSISTSDESAAMYGNYDYYLNPDRGAVPQWSADKFAVMTWDDWLSIDPMPVAAQLDTPTLMIHSDGAVLPQYTKTFFANIATADKQLHWLDTELESPFHQFSFYDQEAEVSESIKQASDWLTQKL